MLQRRAALGAAPHGDKLRRRATAGAAAQARGGQAASVGRSVGGVRHNTTRRRDWEREIVRGGILQICTNQTHMSKQITVKIRWKVDGMAWRAKKVRPMVCRCK